MIRILLFTLAVLCLMCCGSIDNSDSLVVVEEPIIQDIPNHIILREELFYNAKSSTWLYQDSLFSGYAVNYYPNGQLKQKFGILNGKKQNQSLDWYPDQHVKFLSTYHNGKLHGEKKRWSSDSSHVLVAHYNYNMGKADGQQKEWYTTGELYKKLNLRMGKEEGIQQAFRKNGDLYANYEAKEGRIFGLKRTELCFGLQEEQGSYEN